MLGLGNNLNELKSRIQKAQEELSQMGSLEPALPEVINMTNLLRTNEFLTKTDQKKVELITAYEVYTRQLEQIVISLLSIQNDLRDIVKTASGIIGPGKKKSRKKKTKKPTKKTRPKKRRR
jgi:hypothetical protein